MTSKVKHIILENLFNKDKLGVENTGHGKTVTDLGKSMSNIELHKENGRKVEIIDNTCYSLVNNGHIELLAEDENEKIRRYNITESGKQAYLDDYYLNQTRKVFAQFIFWIGMPLLTLIGLILGNSKINNENNKLNNKIEQLEIKLKKAESEIEILKTKKTCENTVYKT
ncbi:hypothetical protein [Aquimarina longa]|uniref:hypothetical protein n=1 Tax=Aquimarina longa TaxID=1080221 RepID=UPI00078062C3|nr:hypothetical protein [Aquimarina longa]